jgi:hypothetical protein
MKMNNYQFPYAQPTTNQAPFGQFQQIQQMFPQPQGSVYSINAPLEIGNVPIGSTGLSVALCLNDNLMYIKSFQGGNPVIMAYKIVPYSKEEETKTSSAAVDAEKTTLEARLERLERLLTKSDTTGGKFDGLL